MRKIYFNLLLLIIFVLIVFYYYYYYNRYTRETFTPSIRGAYRPYIRLLNQHYEYFTTKYGFEPILNKLRKWNIY
jgi:hypothetical protein